MYEFLDYQTQDVMTRDPVTIAPDATLADLEALLEKHDFNGVPVVSASGELVGMVTSLDLLRAFEFNEESVFPPYEDIMNRTVESVMSRDLRSVRPRTPLTTVLAKLVDSGQKSLPVTDGQRLVAIVAREDVMRALRRAAGPKTPDEAA